MTSRCPKCGRNNYGDVRKCSFCGAPLTFIPGEEIKEVSEEDIQEKMATMKVERIRNPTLIFIGGIIGIVGFVMMLVMFLSIMFLVYSPSGIEAEYDSGAFSYKVSGGEQMVFGEITRVTAYEDTNWDQGINHGYQEFTAYEIDGDGSDNRILALREGSVNYESDVWVYSDKDLGSKGDRVLIKVESKGNDYGEERAVSPGYAPWGGRGYLSGWIWLMPGLTILIGGLLVFLMGIVGKADRSMERLMQDDKELRQQQLMLRQAAKKQMEEKEKQRQWQEGSITSQMDQPQPVMETAPPVAQQVDTVPQQPVNNPPMTQPAPQSPPADIPPPQGQPNYQPPQ